MKKKNKNDSQVRTVGELKRVCVRGLFWQGMVRACRVDCGTAGVVVMLSSVLPRLSTRYKYSFASFG